MDTKVTSSFNKDVIDRQVQDFEDGLEYYSA
ncbi:hypothetical protein SAMN04489723_12529 [Algoriphagus aquimarinus]|uniref:Uncharacterized protein n=1 Tax=Algoriphagus aquimarinus TaxID=237018 RepID=A0A1I1C8K8_9BACT|nr:hypothetical protein SAMN04489723_12529 [Algoriphagus aquimarinus]